MVGVLDDGPIRKYARVRMQHLQMVVLLARHGSARETGVAMHLSQTAVTKSLQELESSFGAQLFTRDTQGMAPTSACEPLLRFARITLNELRAVGRAVSAIHRGEAGLLRIRAAVGRACELASAALAQVVQLMPDLRVSFERGFSGEIGAALSAGELDAAFFEVHEALPAESFKVNPLEREETVVVAASSDAMAVAGGFAASTTLAGRLWVLPPTGDPMRRRVEHAFAAASLPPIVATVESRSPGALLDMVASGSGLVGALPESIALPAVRANAVARIGSALAIAPATLSLAVARGHAEDPALRYFVDLLEQ